MTSQVRIEPVKKSEAAPEVRDILEDIQDVMGIPWPPANWRCYAMVPPVLTLFWERIRPAMQSQSFLEDALAITERVYRDTSDWYRPAFRFTLSEKQRRDIARELAALDFGNPQLLIQQAGLRLALQIGTSGRSGEPRVKRHASRHRRPELELVEEVNASEEVQEIYRDIKETLEIPLVNSDYQALAKWPAFLRPAWEDVKRMRQRREYHHLREEVRQMSLEAAGRLRPALRIEREELERAAGRLPDVENVRQMVELFTDLLPGLMVNIGLFSAGGEKAQTLAPAA